MANKIRAIITGSTGMVGEGVLFESLNHPDVEAVLVINRKPCGYTHPKLKEIIHANFFNFNGIEDQLIGYNACFFCLGISSIGVGKDEYYQMTYVLTLYVAKKLSELNKEMTFCYVSGAGTNGNEKGGLDWASVKGRTENDLMKLPFKQVFNFRPGFIKPIKGLKHTHKFYTYINWLFPIGRAVYPNGFCTMQELAHAMINAAKLTNVRRVVEGKDIIALAK